MLAFVGMQDLLFALPLGVATIFAFLILRKELN